MKIYDWMIEQKDFRKLDKQTHKDLLYILREGSEHEIFVPTNTEIYLPMPVEPCWTWQGPMDTRGYGRIKLTVVPSVSHRRELWVGVQVLAALLQYGTIPTGHRVVRICHNPSCCNPAHVRIEPWRVV